MLEVTGGALPRFRTLYFGILSYLNFHTVLWLKSALTPHKGSPIYLWSSQSEAGSLLRGLDGETVEEREQELGCSFVLGRVTPNTDPPPSLYSKNRTAHISDEKIPPFFGGFRNNS